MWIESVSVRSAMLTILVSGARSRASCGLSELVGNLGIPLEKGGHSTKLTKSADAVLVVPSERDRSGSEILKRVKRALEDGDKKPNCIDPSSSSDLKLFAKRLLDFKSDAKLFIWISRAPCDAYLGHALRVFKVFLGLYLRMVKMPDVSFCKLCPCVLQKTCPVCKQKLFCDVCNSLVDECNDCANTLMHG